MIEFYNATKSLVSEVLFPDKCVCGKWGTLICDDCRADIKIFKSDLCPICKRVSLMGRTCASCRHRTRLTGVMILGPHEGVLKSSLWRYKYGFVKGYSASLAGLVNRKFGQFIREKRFVLTAAPISKNRLKWRGFNQAEMLAAELARITDAEYVRLLMKTKETADQVGLSRKQRLANIKGSMKYHPAKETLSKKVLVVDDVYTTGATLEECARILREQGFREVWGLVLTRD